MKKGIFLIWTALGLLGTAGFSRAQLMDASISTGRNFSPFTLLLKPTVQMSPLPGWMSEPAIVQPELATVEVPIPALWTTPAVPFYALTVVFDDRGDGGPSVEWRSPKGNTVTISSGLGEAEKSLGLNARTILLPQDLTREGGTLLVSYYGKFDGIMSLAVRPARDDSLAVLGGKSDLALADEALHVFLPEEVDGNRPKSLGGDVRHGAVVEAELSAPIEPLEGELEFVVPTDGEVEAVMLRLEALGLDPEARIEVHVNSALVGTVEFSAFRLDDPALVADGGGRFMLAGWRSGSLFIPAHFWLPGDNSIVLSLKRSQGESNRKVFLKNTELHLRFGSAPQVATQKKEAPTEPDLTLPDPIIPDAPSDPVLPQVVTSMQR